VRIAWFTGNMVVGANKGRRPWTMPFPSSPPRTGNADHLGQSAQGSKHCLRQGARLTRSFPTQVYAYIQPNGSWCWSNAGVVTNRQTRESVLVDTLTDERLTADMLRHMAPVLDHSPLKLLVHTHGDLDHVLGNALVADNVSQVRHRELRLETEDVAELVRAGQQLINRSHCQVRFEIVRFARVPSCWSPRAVPRRTM
jgi:hypothetical protein